MPTIQYIVPIRDIRHTVTMPSPKNIASMDAWYKAAKKRLNRDDFNLDEWSIIKCWATTMSVWFQMENRQFEKAAIVIRRGETMPHAS